MNPMSPMNVPAAIGAAMLMATHPAAGQCEPPPPVKLMAPDPQPNQLFGRAIAISGDLMAVGAGRDDEGGGDAGAVYLYGRDAGLWTLHEKLMAPGGQSGDLFGWVVDLKGQLLVVGAPGAKNNTGAVHVFRRQEGVWEAEKSVPGSAGQGSRFGEAVAVDSDAPDALMAVGEPGLPGTRVGAVYLYRRNGDWALETGLDPFDGANNDRFGISVDVENGVVAVGAYLHAVFHGAVYVFRDTGLEWVQEQKLMAPDGFKWQGFGLSVSLSLPLVLVGASSLDEDSGEFLPGSAYVFADTEGGWQKERKFESPPGLPADQFGWSVDLRNDTALICAPYGQAAYAFGRASPGSWTLNQTFTTDDPNVGFFSFDAVLAEGVACFGDQAYDHQDVSRSGAVFVSELCPECYADFDGDNSLTLFDFLLFGNAFNDEDARADCDENGPLDLFDFLCFVNAFNEGCG
jgi:hypothetical protein